MCGLQPEEGGAHEATRVHHAARRRGDIGVAGGGACTSLSEAAYDTLIALPDRAPDALLADKGYDADAIRADLASRNIKAVIPGRSNRRVKIDHDRELYKQRNCIERMFGRLKINRSIATPL
jgi:transposase